MTDITKTVSSPDVALVNGKGTLAVSVTNASSTAQRVVLGAYPEGRTATAPTYTSIDQPLRTIANGATEQFVASFDTTGAAPGTYKTKLIAYSADRAPEDYADQGKVIDLVVDAETSAEARVRTERMCRELLANPIIETYRFEVEETIPTAG